MQQRLLAWAKGLLDKWKAFSKQQKTKIIAVTAMLIAVLAVTAYIAMRPKMVSIYEGGTVQDASRVQSALTAAGIGTKTAKNGTQILVNQKNEADALVYLEDNNVITDPGYTYQNAFDIGLGATESTRAEGFRKAAETDMAAKIKKFRGVLDASVSLVIPTDTNYFLPATVDRASASVLITPDGRLDARQGEVIARFVMRSVKSLDMENIEVYDTNANVLFSGSAMSQSGGVSTVAEAEQAAIAQIKANIKEATHLLYDESYIIPNLQFDWDKQSETSTSYVNPITGDGSTGLVNSEQTTKSNYSGTTTDGAPGLDTNDQTTASYQQGNGGTSSGSSSDKRVDYIYGVVQSVKDGQVGKFLKGSSSLAVYLFNYTVYNEQDMADRGLLNDISWAQFKADNAHPVRFDVDPDVIQSLKTGTGINNISVLGYFKPVFVDKTIKPTRMTEFISYAVVILLVLLLAFALLKKAQPDEVSETEPTLTVEEMLVSTKQDEIAQAEAEKMREIEFGAESEVRRQINKFVEEKPEAVAQLLRNWLSEDWK